MCQEKVCFILNKLSGGIAQYPLKRMQIKNVRFSFWERKKYMLGLNHICTKELTFFLMFSYHRFHKQFNNKQDFCLLSSFFYFLNLYSNLSSYIAKLGNNIFLFKVKKLVLF